MLLPVLPSCRSLIGWVLGCSILGFRFEEKIKSKQRREERSRHIHTRIVGRLLPPHGPVMGPCARRSQRQNYSIPSVLRCKGVSVVKENSACQRSTPFSLRLPQSTILPASNGAQRAVESNISTGPKSSTHRSRPYCWCVFADNTRVVLT